MIDPNTVMYLW